MMQVIIKAVISTAVILVATGIARRFPSAAGLVGVMPITSVLVLIWVYAENHGDPIVMQNVTRGSLYGLLPAILFFVVAWIGFRQGFRLPVVLSLSFAVWLVGAIVHQMVLK